MVLKYFNDPVPLATIIKKVGGIKTFGVRMVRLAAFARGLGYTIHCFSYNKKMARGKVTFVKPNTELILKYLQRGRPVIIAVRTALLNDSKPSSSGHIIVITHFKNGTFWYNDPTSARERKIAENDLLFAWYNNALDSSAYMLVLEPSHRGRSG